MNSVYTDDSEIYYNYKYYNYTDNGGHKIMNYFKKNIGNRRIKDGWAKLRGRFIPSNK